MVNTERFLYTAVVNTDRCCHTAVVNTEKQWEIGMLVPRASDTPNVFLVAASY